jgi:hypothetical protein
MAWAEISLPASNRGMRTAAPPSATVGRRLTSEVFEYSGVDTRVTVSVP